MKLQKRISRNRLDDWEDVRVFLAVARAGSLKKATRELGIDQSTVSRRIDRLQNYLGAKLFDRHSKGMTLTPAGRGMLAQAETMETAASAIDRHYAGIDNQMQGLVRIAATEGVAAWWLAPRMVEFQLANPRTAIEFLCGNETIDLAKREADVAIRLAEPEDPRLVRQRVGILRLVLCAARNYLDTFGTPKTIEDLPRHRLLDHTSYNQSGTRAWRDLADRHPSVLLRTNSSVAYSEAIKAGHGIGLAPNYAADMPGNYVLLPIPIDCSFPIYLITHEETNKNARTRAVATYIRELFRRDEMRYFS